MKTTPQIAKQLGVTRQAVIYWIKTGKLKATKNVKRFEYLVDEKDLQQFIKERDDK